MSVLIVYCIDMFMLICNILKLWFWMWVLYILYFFMLFILHSFVCWIYQIFDSILILNEVSYCGWLFPFSTDIHTEIYVSFHLVQKIYPSIYIKGSFPRHPKDKKDTIAKVVSKLPGFVQAEDEEEEEGWRTIYYRWSATEYKGEEMRTRMIMMVVQQ